jgi:hypothetical protein
MIAYRLYRAGKHAAKVRKGREILIPVGDAGKYANGFFRDATATRNSWGRLSAGLGGTALGDIYNTQNA